MPIYEYVCRGCGHAFETIVFGSWVPACPSCRSEDLEKKFSVCAVNAHPTGQLGSDNRGKKVNPFEPGPVCPITPQE